MRGEDQHPTRPEAMVTPSPEVTALYNGQEVPCLIDTGSKVTVMEYDFDVQRFGTENNWTPRLFFKIANNLPILVR